MKLLPAKRGISARGKYEQIWWMAVEYSGGEDEEWRYLEVQMSEWDVSKQKEILILPLISYVSSESDESKYHQKKTYFMGSFKKRYGSKYRQV